MAYKHKKASCSKTSKDILENIIRCKDSEYGLNEPSETIKATSLLHEIVEGKPSPNALPYQDEALVSEEETEDVQVHDHATDDFENYKPATELKFDCQEPKVRFEKKGKHRNYAEFRFDYGKR
jgi:hypothetical protein